MISFILCLQFIYRCFQNLQAPIIFADLKLVLQYVYYYFISFFFYIVMRKVLAVASVGIEHKELVFKDLKSIFKRIKISLDVLLQEELLQPTSSNIDSSTVFKSYPYITLTIPSYEQHREYLEKIYKNNVLFSKFILLISKGDSYQQLLINRNEQILRQHCRNWNTVVKCTFDSAPLFTQIEEQVSKINKVLGEMDIRGKICEIDAKKKFHLIEDHRKEQDHNPHPGKYPKIPNKLGFLKLFFGLEVGCGKRVRNGCTINNGISSKIASCGGYSAGEDFADYDDEEIMMMMDVEESTQDVDIQNNQSIIQGGRLGSRRWNPQLQSGKIGGVKRQAKRRFEQNLASDPKKNPYLKKKYPHEVILSLGNHSMNS